MKENSVAGNDLRWTTHQQDTYTQHLTKTFDTPCRKQWTEKLNLPNNNQTISTAIKDK